MTGKGKTEEREGDFFILFSTRATAEGGSGTLAQNDGHHTAGEQ